MYLLGEQYTEFMLLPRLFSVRQTMEDMHNDDSGSAPVRRSF